jgi:amino acid transporter
VLIWLQVLTEVRNAPKTLRKAAPISIAVVMVLYMLANIAYVSGHNFFCLKAPC